MRQNPENFIRNLFYRYSSTFPAKSQLPKSRKKTHMQNDYVIGFRKAPYSRSIPSMALLICPISSNMKNYSLNSSFWAILELKVRKRLSNTVIFRVIYYELFGKVATPVFKYFKHLFYVKFGESLRFKLYFSGCFCCFEASNLF